MLRKMIVVVFIFLAHSTQAEIKKWQDEKGKWHFSDGATSKNSAKEYKSTAATPPVAEEKSKLLLKETLHGHYYHYIGRTAVPGGKIIVINHGMFGKHKTEFMAAQEMLAPWLEFADKYAATLVAPVFDNAAFAVTKADSADGGYRGLFGRDINADDFLHEIIAEYQTQYPQYDGRFYLVGHSAGAQFSNRYMVRHPERVIAAAYSAPAWFAFPDPNLKWPLGIGRRKFTQTWAGRGLDKPIDVRPDISWWTKAVQIPALVAVGETDLLPMRHIDNIGGDTHVARAEFWVSSMNKFAQAQGIDSKQKIIILPNIGHDYKKIAPTLQNFILLHWQ